MTQSHKSKQTIQVLTKKAFGKWKRKTVVLKKTAENQTSAELYIYHRLQLKPIRKIYSWNENVIQISPHSHAVIQELTEEDKPNVLGLLKLQGSNEENACHFFCASSEQEAAGLNKLGETIKDLCDVISFNVDIESPSSRIPSGPAYLHISKNRVYLSSKTPGNITILKEWQFHSPREIFRFEVCSIHISDASDPAKEEVFLCCRSKEDVHNIEHKILSCCNSSFQRLSGISKITTPPQHPVLPRKNKLSMSSMTLSSSTINYSCSSSPFSSQTQSPTLPESPVFPYENSMDLQITKAQSSLNIPQRSKSMSAMSLNPSPKIILKPTQSSPVVMRSKKIQSPKHSVKEHVDIRFPSAKRSKSASDLAIRPISKEQEKQLRALSLDSNQASRFKNKPKVSGSEQTSISSLTLNFKPWNKNPRKGESEESINKREVTAGGCCEHVATMSSIHTTQSPIHEINKSVPKTTHGDLSYSDPTSQHKGLEDNESNLKAPMKEDVSEIQKELSTIDTALYVNIEARANCYIYRNVSCPDDAPEIPNTYVNVFYGSSIKGCYENCHSGVFGHELIYSDIEKQYEVPPPMPRPRLPPPRLPPKGGKQSHKENYPGIRKRENVAQRSTPEIPQRPPKRPPKLTPPNNTPTVQPSLPLSPVVHNSAKETCITPRIQVALFASLPVSGLVWFLRVAFMHQDDNDTTFKRVKGIEEASQHKLLKSELLEVSTDIDVKVNLLTEGFNLLNESQQDVENSDIGNLRKGDWFVIEFHIQQLDQTQVQFNGNVSIGPKTKVSCSRISKAIMGISEHFLTKPPMSPTCTSNEPSPRSWLLDFSTHEKLCKALDQTTNTQSRDWRQVADLLGFTREEIMELTDKYFRNVNFSPTNAILQVWEQRDPKCSLERLVNILRNLGRLDIVQDLGYSIEPEGKWNDGFKKV